MASSRLAIFILLFTLIILGSIILTIVNPYPPQKNLRRLGMFYLNQSFFGNYSAKSPETVTAIVWDYRGLDTVYEVTVFFLAIMGGLTLFRIEDESKKEKVKESVKKATIGLTLIVRQATKILVALIIAVSASIALHGHLTPGGGFQGGSALAIAPLLIIAAYSRYVLEEHGLTYIKAIIARSISLLCIFAVAVFPLTMGYYILQNQPFYPAFIYGQLLSGSLFLFNLFDYIAIGMGFTAIFLYLSIPEKIYRKIMGEEK